MPKLIDLGPLQFNHIAPDANYWPGRGWHNRVTRPVVTREDAFDYTTGRKPVLKPHVLEEWARDLLDRQTLEALRTGRWPSSLALPSGDRVVGAPRASSDDALSTPDSPQQD